nr:immunoglobulin light chain junction region [Macaca mulatta]
DYYWAIWHSSAHAFF